MSAPDVKSEELAEIIRAIRERVRSRYPDTAASGASLPDLLPVLHARDAVEGKVASIGTVNPRAPGLLNNAIQAVKRLAARMLDWHVREQVEFNRAVVTALDAILEALNENNRVLAPLPAAFQEAKDASAHWAEWRLEWEHKLAATENQFLRSVAESQAAFQHRTSLMEANLREAMKDQQERGLLQASAELDKLQKNVWADVGALQQRMWSDLERVRGEFERLIHSELRVIRQRAMLPVAPAAPAAATPSGGTGVSLPFDQLRFADRFRGSEEHVRERQRWYVDYFRGCREVLDIGCGRGEFLELMREAGVPARGIDLSAESVAVCRAKGLQAETADVFGWLGGLSEAALDGIFCAHVIEHLPLERLPEMLKLAAERLAAGSVLALETPNPECLAIFATHFYIDPTHVRPVPPQLLAFYLEEFGLGKLELHRLAPAADSFPALDALPAELREAFFGGLDYALIARKL